MTEVRVGSAQQVLARVRARMITRYKLAQRGAKAHELVRSDGLGVSTGYCGGEIRFRLMRDGVWTEQFDVPVPRAIPTNRSLSFDAATLVRLDEHFEKATRC